MALSGSGQPRDDFRALLDRELSTSADDAFGHQDFAKVLRSLVESSDNDPPFSIGLLGRWGTGKSSIKGIYLASMADHDTGGVNSRRRSDRFYPITFNAWRYGGEDLKRALLRHVYLKLGGKEPDFNDAVFHHMQAETQRTRSIAELWRDFLDKFLFSTLQVIVMLVLLIAGFLATLWMVQAILPVAGDLGRAVFALVVAGLFSVLARPLLDWRRFVIPSHTNLTRIELPASTAEQYEDLLATQLRNFMEGKTDIKQGKTCERIIVFVDDLDRLSAEEMVDGLDAIRTFMDMPRPVHGGSGVVFVVSCDEERVADALANRRRQRNSDLPAAVFSSMDAHRYLDRIFQFRLEIPPMARRDMRDYAKKRLLQELPEIVEDLQGQGVAIENVTERLVHVGVQDPRNVLHLLNAFSQSWWLARCREFEGAGSDRPGGLQEGAVTSHPVALAALCGLRVDFPDFYKDLQREPALIGRFTDVFLRGRDLEEEPEMIREVLRRYGQDNAESENMEVKPMHHPLRQYIASLQGVRWPSTLQPLLLLAQDPVTRRLGDRARPVYEAFVSGDERGVLEALGHGADSDNLSGEEMDLLRDMEEGLVSEPEIRRNNAGAILAELADRFPEDRAGQLLGPLARRLADSPELRWRVGVSGMGHLFPRVRLGDRRELTGTLISDLLKLEGEMDFRLPSGEAPSPDEALNMAEEACSMALEVREHDGLPNAVDSRLLEWLGVRRVAIGDEEDGFGFDRLESWMDDHEENLLRGLGERYTGMLSEEMTEDNVEDIDIAAAMRRSRIVFDRLWEAGQESRAVLWEQLSGYASVRAKEAVALSWEMMLKHPGAASPSAATLFIERLGSRLLTRLDDTEHWDLDWSAGSRALVEIVETYRDGLETSAVPPLVSLAQRWGVLGSSEELVAQLAIRLLDQVRLVDEDAADEIIEHWSSRILSQLRDPCRVWLAEHFADALSDEQRAQLVEHLEATCLDVSITEDQGELYQHFMSRLDEDGIYSTEMQNHLTKTIGQVAQQHQSPTEYLYRVFPALAPLIAKAPEAQAGSMLTNLFVNPRVQQLGYFGWLHGEMAEHWPTKDDLSSCDPQSVFTTAATVVATDPSDVQAPGILHSMREMVARSVVGDDNVTQVLQTAAQLWPHHTTTSLGVIRAFEVALDPPVVAGLATNVDLGDEEIVEALAQAWTHEAAAMSFEEVEAVARQILSKQPEGTDDEPDRSLRLWVDAGSECKAQLLKVLLLDPDLNDGQRKRVWLQAIWSSEELGRGFVLTTLPGIFELDDMPETGRSVLDGTEILTRLFPTSQEKNELSRTLLESLSAASSVEMKKGLADWMKEISGGAALRRLGSDIDLTEDEVEILARRFPGARTLRKYRNRRS